MLSEKELADLDSRFSAPTLHESLDYASRQDPDISAESNLTPISAELYKEKKPEIDRQKQLSNINSPLPCSITHTSFRL